MFSPLREQRVFVVSPFGPELLDGGEDDAAGGHLQQLLQMRRGSPACSGSWRSSSCPAAKVPKSWSSRSLRSVRTISVGLCHGRLLDDLAGVEEHGEALAAALGVPDHADLAVAARAGGAHRGVDGRIDRVVLVIGGRFLEQCAPRWPQTR